MYFTAIICVFYISANDICLHRTTKIDKLLYKLSCMICYITMSNSYLNPPYFSVFFFSTKLLAVYVVIIAFVFSDFLTLHRPPIAAIVVESALGHLVLLFNCYHHIWSALLNCKIYLVFVVIAFVFSCSLALHHPPIAAAEVKSTLGCLVLLSNCCYCIRSALSSCKGYLIFLSLLFCCGVSAFCLYKCQLNSFCLKLRVDLKKNKSLTTPKSCHG